MDLSLPEKFGPVGLTFDDVRLLPSGTGCPGCVTIADLEHNAQLVRITAAGLKQSHPHDVQMTIEAPDYPGR